MRAGGEVEVCPARVDGLELLAKRAWISSVPAGALDKGRQSRGDDGAWVGRSRGAMLTYDAEGGHELSKECMYTYC